MMRATRPLAALAAAAAVIGGLALTRSTPASEEAYWVCVYVDHVHLLACQDKPIDFYPDDEDDKAKSNASRGAAVLGAATHTP